jgi:hypothetical protein
LTPDKFFSKHYRRAETDKEEILQEIEVEKKKLEEKHKLRKQSSRKE